jgi:hypothetical protein
MQNLSTFVLQPCFEFENANLMYTYVSLFLTTLEYKESILMHIKVFIFVWIVKVFVLISNQPAKR